MNKVLIDLQVSKLQESVYHARKKALQQPFANRTKLGHFIYRIVTLPRQSNTDVNYP